MSKYFFCIEYDFSYVGGGGGGGTVNILLAFTRSGYLGGLDGTLI